MGPECVFKGKTVPCLCCWNPKGSITLQILVDILETVDDLDVFDQAGGVTPFLCVDGHDSRFEFPLLSYVCNHLHIWTVCIGVPYGTALWQIGDSAEQNNSCSMASVVYKRETVEENEK